MRHRVWRLALVALLLACGACRQPSAPAPAQAAAPGAERPAQAVSLLTRHLRDNDLAAFARDAVPADLHAQLDAAWREGRTRWPLDALPLGERVPQMLGALARPGAEARLGADFDRQFARADAELKSTAATLGLFTAQYLRNEGDFSESEREHYAQLVVAATRWAQAAPLSDPQRARAAIAQLAAAARQTGLASDADFALLGLQDSLRRLSGFSLACKQVLAGYGLDLDAGLGALDASLQSQTGDSALVRMRYRFAGEPIDAIVRVERIEGRWYVSDFLRQARAAAAKPAAAPAASAPARPPSG
ncbi:hypothetical protein [Luteimonas aquatica]|uniref:hypothetical protein n=1 Tax=Luteimonas aquatica TaxID=450364 RepID=UPI001F56FF3B|nr:hypothetical protein [Luteimonas aquatica]